MFFIKPLRIIFVLPLILAVPFLINANAEPQSCAGKISITIDEGGDAIINNQWCAKANNISEPITYDIVCTLNCELVTMQDTINFEPIEGYTYSKIKTIPLTFQAPMGYSGNYEVKVAVCEYGSSTDDNGNKLQTIINVCAGKTINVFVVPQQYYIDHDNFHNYIRGELRPQFFEDNPDATWDDWKSYIKPIHQEWHLGYFS